MQHCKILVTTFVVRAHTLYHLSKPSPPGWFYASIMGVSWWHNSEHVLASPDGERRIINDLEGPDGPDGPTTVIVNSMIRSISKIDDYKMVSCFMPACVKPLLPAKVHRILNPPCPSCACNIYDFTKLLPAFFYPPINLQSWFFVCVRLMWWMDSCIVSIYCFPFSFFGFAWLAWLGKPKKEKGKQ